MGFQFRQFRVNDEHSSMKVGTDAVLLGAWAGQNEPENILDIGTGCGVIALMMAQRFSKACITGIDIHEASVSQAGENFDGSPWSNRLEAVRSSLQQYSIENRGSYDLVISNPPFFSESLLPPDPSRKLARHTGSLSYEDLVKATVSLLAPGGNFALILPFENKISIHRIAKEHGLFLQRELIIIPVRGKRPNRYMSEWGHDQLKTSSYEMAIRTENGLYTEEYKELTGGFYLAL